MKIFIALGSLLVLALLTLLVGPRFVDWTAYRSSFEAEAGRILGQKVVVNGRASLRLLPFPSVTFGDVVVGDDPADPVLTMRGFRMDAELAPYLSGEIRIFDMQIDAPRLNVAIASDGTVRSPLGAGAQSPDAAVVLEKIEVSNGSAVLEDRRSGRRITLTDIDADVSANSLRGPFNGAGTLFANGEPLSFTLSSGVGTPDGAWPVRLGLESERADIAVAVEVLAKAGPGGASLDGKLLVTSPLETAAEKSDAPGPARLLPPFRLESALRISSTTVEASDLRAAIGEGTTPYLATGAASLDWGTIPHFDLRLDGQEIDLDTVAPSASQADDSASATLAARIEGVRTALARIPTIYIPGRVSLSLPLATVGGTTLRELRFAGSPSQTGWSIERLSAELPGRTLIEASGIATVRGEPGFKGTLLVAARQPAALLRWAGASVDPVLGRLDRAGFSAEVELSADTQAFRALELDLGGRILNGSVVRTLRPEDRVTAVDLHGDAVALDPFVALAHALLPGSASLPEGERLDVQFEANPFTYDGFEAAHLATDFTLADGLLDISSLDAAGFAGADIHLEGTIAGIGAVPTPDLSLDIAAEDPERFIDFLQGKLPGSPLVASLRRTAQTLGPLALRGTAASETRAGVPVLAVDLAGTAAGTDLGLRLSVENGLAAASIDGRFGLDVTLATATPAVLLDQFGLTVLPFDLPGPLTVTLAASGAPSEAMSVSLRAGAPGSTATATGRASVGAEGLGSFEGRLDVTSDDAAPWMTALSIAAGQDLSRLPLAVAGDLAWRPGQWSMTGLAGSVADARILADLAASTEGRLGGTLHVTDLSSRWLEMLLTGVDSEGGSAETPPAFRSALLPDRPFRLAFAADRFDGWGLPISGLRADLTGAPDSLRIDGFEGRLSSGRIAGSGEFRNVAGFVSLDAKPTVEGIAVALGDEAAPLLAGTANATAQLRAGGQSVPDLLASLDGTGTLTLADGRLRGVRPDLLAPILAALDQDGARIDPADVASRVAQTTADAVAILPPVDAPFTIGAGTLRLAPLSLDLRLARLTGEPQMRLTDRTLSGALRLDLALPANDDTVDPPTPAIGYALEGTLAAPALVANTEPLASYLAARAYQREQARVEALEEDLRETVRLRREARLYRERSQVRETLRLEREAREADAAREAAARETAAREAGERERLAAIEAERVRLEKAAAAAKAAAEAKAAEEAAMVIMQRTLPDPAPSSGTTGPLPAVETPSPIQRPAAADRSLDFDRPASPSPAVPPPKAGFGGLPGVINPNAF
ncbi:AsmA family protein [Aureimonas sp. AU12]|uniref:AsmA family protein n=1 Tax=Aureimonas sp. AU12 TaxID=1638161 RepID=UPI000782D7EC|nr:AsmA-like C-terminal region-containing protein [Aureimonas sp. AU12]